MSGGNQSRIKLTYRNPLNHDDFFTVHIDPEPNVLSEDWITALKILLQGDYPLEKNYCFMGFPYSARDTDYLCEKLNYYIDVINKFNEKNTWYNNGLPYYFIEEYFCTQSVQFGDNLVVGAPENGQMGLQTKHGQLNRLHNHFEHLQGTVWDISPYYQLADIDTKFAIRQLNNICHELENYVMAQRKLKLDSFWVRPSQITTFLHAPRYELTDEHRQGFRQNRYDRVMGGVYMHWAQIGKTLFEVWRDENAPALTVGDDVTNITLKNQNTCEAITALKYYSGEFDIEWANDVVDNGQFIWHTIQQIQFTKWLADNGLDPDDARLSLGYLKIAQVDLDKSFGTRNYEKIWQTMGDHLDVYKIDVDGITKVFDDCWSDDDYEEKQKKYLMGIEK